MAAGALDGRARDDLLRAGKGEKLESYNASGKSLE
jgi:hypothetical protein